MMEQTGHAAGEVQTGETFDNFGHVVRRFEDFERRTVRIEVDRADGKRKCSADEVRTVSAWYWRHVGIVAEGWRKVQS